MSHDEDPERPDGETEEKQDDERTVTDEGNEETTEEMSKPVSSPEELSGDDLFRQR